MKGLPRTPRTYFDGLCHECQQYPMERKLLDIGYAIWHGHDIIEDIKDILENHPYISKSDIQYTIWRLIATANHLDPIDCEQFDRNNTLEVDVEILIEDLMRIFRLPDNDRSQAYLAEDPRDISFYELDRMNGWKKAMDQPLNTLSLYSFGKWIMFPGDGELIRKFNLEKATQGHGYISYVYPEPWYGAPTYAKVIILGNESRYDDFISRTQNILLHCAPQLEEEVHSHVNGWLGLYNYEFARTIDQEIGGELLSGTDVYNSPTYRHWLNEIQQLAIRLDIENFNEMYSKIAVINANPYPSIGVGALEAGMLPSHFFLRQLVRFITNEHPDVLFVLPSEHLRPVWRTILGDVYTDLVAFGRMIVINENRSTSLTRSISKKHLHILRSILHPS